MKHSSRQILNKSQLSVASCEPLSLSSFLLLQSPAHVIEKNNRVQRIVRNERRNKCHFSVYLSLRAKDIVGIFVVGLRVCNFIPLTQHLNPNIKGSKPRPNAVQ